MTLPRLPLSVRNISGTHQMAHVIGASWHRNVGCGVTERGREEIEDN
ncbi:hypothetical protein [Planktothrix pseudagardhii]|uniref:Uncharacterized protein n=1 Tax=Planktothrix pseudagardhii TaxID=132604 RepID=A0A9W4D9T7_9CYAN|nr:hypothetical protein [Planktothrix pseudagardhii]CAD5983997.1 hypothetical protein NO713_05238 [Planktothrix pseudagardhii]